MTVGFLGGFDPTKLVRVQELASLTTWKPNDWPEVQVGDLAIIFTQGFTSTSGWTSLSGIPARYRILQAGDMAVTKTRTGTYGLSPMVLRNVKTIINRGGYSIDKSSAPGKAMTSYIKNADHSGMMFVSETDPNDLITTTTFTSNGVAINSPDVNYYSAPADGDLSMKAFLKLYPAFAEYDGATIYGRVNEVPISGATGNIFEFTN